MNSMDLRKEFPLVYQGLGNVGRVESVVVDVDVDVDVELGHREAPRPVETASVSIFFGEDAANPLGSEVASIQEALRGVMGQLETLTTHVKQSHPRAVAQTGMGQHHIACLGALSCRALARSIFKNSRHALVALIVVTAVTLIFTAAGAGAYIGGAH